MEASLQWIPLIVTVLYLGIVGIGIKLSIKDARRRGKSPLLVCLATVLFFPLGTIVWLLFRPEPRDPSRPKHTFRLDDHRIQ
jgi:hypothetical protein